MRTDVQAWPVSLLDTLPNSREPWASVFCHGRGCKALNCGTTRRQVRNRGQGRSHPSTQQVKSLKCKLVPSQPEGESPRHGVAGTLLRRLKPVLS